ncbi:protocatechuate 3,4-dioxygenase [Phreatobacter sp.]|uniref:protocatechuate 3,4-dioxygenase n=1 Tax=Phreatobacter sp. TaxID=1966341 RepID=UPI0022C1FB90|nr:protocatechuate 3,4-dioxygenase [Phreatobacter sp.]MCZ8317182.1 protocatechuate 3,4-dioxygenase [Phreatobacter sp.]
MAPAPTAASLVSLSRRGLVAAPALMLLVRPLGATVIATPPQMVGPYYPVAKPTDSDIDLTEVKGRSGRATGEIIEVHGRVLSARSGPLGGALVEIWQADHQGRYHHPDENAGPADPNFQGFGAVRTAAGGEYLFRTIMPRFYGSGRFQRTPHIHFRVVAEGRPEFVTQMYFPGVAMNARDFLFSRLGGDAARDAVTARREPADLPRFRFEVVLA